MSLSYVVFFSALCGLALATVIDIRLCQGSQTSVCEITEVRIDPCKNKAACVLKKGANASISFDFKPNFRAEKLKTLPFYQGTGFAEFGSTDGCLFTKCPTEPGVIQTMNYNLVLSKKLPNGIYTFDWKVWNEDNENESCCFMPTIRLKK